MCPPMRHRFQPARRLLGAAIAFALLLTMTVTSAATASTRAFSCMPASGLMGLNSPEAVMAGTVTLPQGVKVRIGTTGDVDWDQTRLDKESARLFYSLKWLDPLTREAARAKDPAPYLERAQAIARDFLRDNPVGGGADPDDAWNPMYGGQRATVYSCLDSLDDDPGIQRDLAVHGAWLADPATDPGDWNQAIDPALGLLGAGCRLDRAAWRQQAADRLGRLIEVNIDAQGALNEQAPGYAGFIYDRWGIVADKLEECGQTVPRTIAERRPLLLEFAAWSVTPDGRFAQIGDTYLEAPRVVPGSPTDYVTSGGRRGTHPNGTYKVYDAGFVFGRNSWTPFAGGMHYSLRFGPGRDFHGHEDHQSVTLAAYGRSVLVDTGHVGYTDPDKRLWLRAPEAHNVLVPRGEQLKFRRPTALVRSADGPGWQFFEVSDQAYGDPVRTRGVLADTQLQALLVQDRTTRPTAGWFDQFWHLPVGSRVTLQGRDRAVARDPSGSLDTHVIQIPLPGQTLPDGATGVVDGWIAPAVDRWQAAPVVRTSRTGTSARMVTAVVPVKAGTKVTTSLVTKGSNWIVTISAGSTSRSYGLSAGGSIWVVDAPGSPTTGAAATVPDERGPAVLDEACPTGQVARSAFTDLGGTPFTDDIACAVDWGVITGIDDTTFAPARTVTRAQLATMLDRLLTASGYRLPAATNRFPDVPTGNVHAAAIGRIAAAGVVAGRADGRFDPAGNVTRGQLATMLMRLYDEVWSGSLPARTGRLDDVPSGTAHEAGARTMAALEVMPPIVARDGDFVPGAAVTRAQLTSHLMMLADRAIGEGSVSRP